MSRIGTTIQARSPSPEDRSLRYQLEDTLSGLGRSLERPQEPGTRMGAITLAIRPAQGDRHRESLRLLIQQSRLMPISLGQ
jgi:hypothetical protein